MGKHEKTIMAMRNNLRDWRIEKLEAVAAHVDLTVHKSRGSHVVFQKTGGPIVVTVLAKKPIKPVYVTQFLALIDWRPE